MLPLFQPMVIIILVDLLLVFSISLVPTEQLLFLKVKHLKLKLNMLKDLNGTVVISLLTSWPTPRLQSANLTMQQSYLLIRRFHQY